MLKNNKKLILFLGILGVALAVVAYRYFLPKEQASLEVATSYFPAVTRYETPDNLSITFQNSADTLNKEYQKQMSSPIAPLDAIDKEVTSGVSLSPALSGSWRWSSENTLTFTPKQDWPANQEFVINLNQKIFDANALELATTSIKWVTPAFEGSIDRMSLEQDIAGGKDHNIFATMTFTHPVDIASVKKNLKLFDSANAQEIPYELTHEANLKTLYVRSDTVAIADKERYIKLFMGKDIQTTLGKTSLYEAQESKILIPDIYSFLKISYVNYSIINNKDANPEQIFHISLTDAVTFEEFSKHAKVAVELHDKAKQEASKNSFSTKLTLLPIQGTSSKDYFFKSEIPLGGQVSVTLLKGMRSVNGFVLRRDIKERRYIPAYPTEIKIMGEGSILALSGEKKVSFAVRGVNGLKVSVQKLQDEQINHLISQTNGDITSPYFRSYSFNFENITEKQLQEVIPLASHHPKDQNYASLDLSKYLRNQGSGIFFIQVEDYNIEKKQRDFYIEDKRLIIVTDMGIVVKKANDGSRDVFVESIIRGKPIDGAKVSVLGKNGQAIETKLTSSEGKASFLNLDSYTQAQTPTVIVAQKGNDLSFIPYESYARNINYSRYDISGVGASSADKNKELSAYAFSDRGIYRPGENVHLASVVRQGDFYLEKGTVVRAKVFDAQNKTVYRKDFSLDPSGFFEIDMPTSLSSPTGTYSFNIYLPVKTSSGYESENYLGGASFALEEFQPDTMKIKTKFNPYKSAGWVGLKDLKAQVTLTNLFGLPAQNRNIHARATLTPTQFHFSKYAEYKFATPRFNEKMLRSQEIHFNDMKTDKQGFASFDVQLPYDEGVFRLDFDAEGFEPDGGRSVRAKTTALLSNAPYMLGVKADGDLSYLKKGQERSLHFIAVDAELNLLPLQNLKLEVIHNKRLSVLTKQRDGRYAYESVIQKESVKNIPFSIEAKGEKVALDTREGGDFTLNIVDANGTLLSSVDYYVATKGNTTGALEKNAQLSVKLNKQTYKPLEEIELNIVAPYTGTGLITIESDAVYAHKWFQTTTKSSLQKITLPANLEGNAYVNVTFVRAIDSQEIFTSPLSFAVAPFSINSEKRRIHIDLEAPKLIKPGENLTMQYKTDRKSKIVVYAVNEGILQVAKYELPDPLKHFLKKRALLVQTSQILDLLLPEFHHYVERAGIGGDMMEMMAKSALGANLNPFGRTLDKPAVFWSGIIDADTQTREIHYRVPDTFNGALKVMAFAVSDEAMGSVFTKTEVRGPFVLSPNVLTVAAPHDTFDVTVGVSNAMQGSGKDAPVAISIETTPNLKLLSQKSVTKAISEGDEDKVTFTLQATESLGEAKVTFKASHANHFQTRTATLSIRPAQHYETTIQAGYKKDVGSVAAERVLYKELASKTISASNSPLVLATGLGEYLSAYPHGCTEQIISQTFPWVALSQSSHFKDTLVDAKANGVLSMLATRQLGDGGFGLWPTSNTTDEFASLYAMHFLTQLKKTTTTVSIPSTLYEGGIDYLRNIAAAQTSTIQEARHRALAIYLLIQNEEVATNYLIDLHTTLQKGDKSWEKDITSAYIAASYMSLKKFDVARKLIESFDPSYASGYTDFQSNLTMNAQYIYLVSTHFPKKELDVAKNILPLLEPLMQGKVNTVSASYTILALSAYSQKNEQKYGEDALEFFVIGTKKVALPKAALKPFMMAKVPLEEREVTIESKAPLFYQLVQSGYDKKPHDTSFAKGIEIFKEYVDKNGTVVQEVNQGDELEVRIKVRATEKSYISNVVLVDLLPGGFEVLRESVPRDNNGWRSDYVDIREDRVVFYAGFSNRLTELRYKVKATAAGTFIVPSASAASMYDPDILSHTAASKIRVK